MSPRSFAALVVLLLVLAVAPTAVLGAAPATGPESGLGAEEVSLQTPHNSSLDPGDAEMRVDLAADGDARWRVTTVLSADGPDEREAFRELAADFRSRESPLGLSSFRAAAENASDVTGRSMEIESVEANATLHNETGSLWVSFTWTNFGRTSGDRLAVDDVFSTASGVWLDSLSADETLVVAPPTGYGVSSAPTGSTSAPSSLEAGVARWEGPQDFGDRGPWIVYSGDASATTPTPSPIPGGPNGTATATADGPTTGPGTQPGGGGGGDGGPLSVLPIAGVILLAGATAAVLAVYMQRDDEGGLGSIVGTGGDDNGGDGASADDAAPRADDGGRDTEPEVAAPADAGPAGGGESVDGPEAAAGAAGAAVGGATADAADGTDEVDEELLSDEERVERLIENNGGRMKQAAIVQETGWSNAKVSQLLSSMDDDGRIEKLRIGRENLISFPDEDVTDIDSE